MSRKKMVSGNGLFYPILGFASCMALIYMSFGDVKVKIGINKGPKMEFVQRNGSRFMVDGKPFYVNGWNSYWLMDHAVDDYGRNRVGLMMQTGSKMGLTVCRTWAFNDGTYNALQISPGVFDERVFTGLDYVIAEARRHGIRLILCLVNNLQAYGGKTQYVKWAWEENLGLSSSNDSFFYDPSIRDYFKNYIKVILTRKNSITGIRYKDDPTIFGWELINEPRCATDASGDTLQDWLEEMSAFMKSIDSRHMITVGLEGFYGPKSPKKLDVNPEAWASRLGADFIRNNQIPNIDFASVHIYPDHWFRNLTFEENVKYLSTWMLSHIEDGEKELNKPVMFTEFGLSSLNEGFEHEQRDKYYRTIYDIMYKSARKGGAGAGAFIWQFLVDGMEEYNDDFGMVPWEKPTIYSLVVRHSCKLARVQGATQLQTTVKALCLQRRPQ